MVAHHVRGVQVHDARLAAIMQAYGLTHILTLNQPDFLRYANLQAILPSKCNPPFDDRDSSDKIAPANLLHAAE